VTRRRRLDLGAGLAVKPGFVGVDRFFLPGVSVVADLDARHLPFPDDVFDLVYAFHSLEHVADLMATRKEVWRVGKPGAQICITAPYYAMSLNLANPYHKQTSTSTRRASGRRRRPVRSIRQIGGSRRWERSGAWRGSDNSDPGFDLRCLRMEFLGGPRCARVRVSSRKEWPRRRRKGVSSGSRLSPPRRRDRRRPAFARLSC
jgi:SAM-dependent methyltransferase